MEHLLEADARFVWHPFSRQKNKAPIVPVSRGKGSLLFDEQGKPFVDAISSWWVTIHGHAHPYIAERIYNQALTLEQVIFAGFTHRPAVELAARLVPLLPGNFSKVFYSDNGSTATEVALKMAVQYWWNRSREHGAPARTRILAFRNSYHGDTFGAMSVSERSVFTMAFHHLLLEVDFIDTPTQENIGELRTFLEKEGDAIAAFIYEPLVQGAGGIMMYEADLLNQLLAAAHEKEVICIADEVMTGFGRTGTLFASEQLAEKPDIICLSKGLTGGTMALGATVCSEKVYSAFVHDDALRTFFHGHSFTANPLACTAALASLELFEKENTLKAVENIVLANRNFLPELELFVKKGLIRSPRICGTILAFELTSSAPDGYLNPIGQYITEEAMLLGVYLRPLGNTLYIMPPYCITKEELRKVYDTILSLLEKLDGSQHG
ncbi:MAG: adenosylmethionine--8-amino-7-oxononanoate transaminase [Chitinophagaceae bacterium]